MGKKTDHGRVAGEPEKEADVGYTDMWGDRLVGKIEIPVLPEPPVTEEPDAIKIEGNYYLHRDCCLYLHGETGEKKKININRKGIAVHKDRIGRVKRFDMVRLIAEHFVPNPLGLPYPRHMQRAHTRIRLEDVRWSSKPTKPALVATALHAERFPGYNREILEQKECEQPVTVILKSRV